MLVAFFSAVVGAVVGAVLTVILTKWLLPNSKAEIASIRQEVSELKKQFDQVEDSRHRQKQDDELWAEKFERAVKQVVKIGPSNMVTLQDSNSITPLFGLVFPDNDMRGRILTFLVQKDDRYTSFSMRSWSDEQLRRPNIRQVIEETLGQLEKFKAQYPQYSHYLG
jgi:FtsZ-binding cell division protein ZapB